MQRSVRIARIAIRNFTRFRLQSVLVVFAAALGVAGVLISAGYADGGRQKIIDRFYRLGTNVITVTPRQSRAVGGRARTGAIVQTLSAADYAALMADVPAIDVASATVTGSFRIRAGDLTKSATVVGCEPDYFSIKHWDITRGATFDRQDEIRQSRVVLLGQTVAADLFGKSDPTGQRITINRVPFVIAGVLAERGQSLDAANEDDQVYVPLSAAMHRLMNIDYYGAILFELDDSSQLRAAAERMTALLHRRHQSFSPTSDDFQIQNQKSLIDAQFAAFERLSFLIGWISISTLAVSGFGIWGISWIGVRNRTREIGARRAIGATRGDILAQFLTEASIGCLIGCAIGIATAYISIRWLDVAVDQPFIFDWSAALWNVLGAAGLFAMFVAIASWRAAILDPIEALRA